MPNQDNASLVITTASFNGTAFGIAQNIGIATHIGSAPLQAQGDLGTTVLGITAKGGSATVTWVAGAGASIFTVGTKGTLTFASKDAAGGGSHNYTATNMQAMDGSIVHADRTYAVLQQTFINVSSDGEFLTT